MSKSNIIVNGENSSDVVDFTTDANINMVAVNDISCAKHLENFGSKDSGQGLLSYPCDFDHIYASSMNESAKSKTVNSEISLLKELLLSHLDLIQQQSEQLVTKDKQISALQQENDTLKLRLERMDRRVTLQKHRDVPESPPCSNSNSSIINTLSVPSLSSIGSLAVVTSPDNNGPIGNVTETVNNTTSIRKRKRDDAGSICSAGSKRTNRSASWNSMRDIKEESAANISGKLNGRASKKESAHRRRRKKQIKNGDDINTLKKDESILLTGFQYYTPVGDADDIFDIDEPKVNGCVLEVPSWRTKHFTSCYTMEGTENLSEDVFERRHARLEVDERRRKRWDVQRIREQRQIERLRQRQRKGDGGDDESEALTTFWPHPDEAEYIQVTDMLPVSAFGCPLPHFKPTNFVLVRFI
ncbi:male-specific lethal 1 isoform X2 [Lycorma delicatula]|uniref:male-specific lethal 1 isoform X2 n=1 Tax=Lycorma delicatula TaxID=130591 RepID=UPI003F50FC2A